MSPLNELFHANIKIPLSLSLSPLSPFSFCYKWKRASWAISLSLCLLWKRFMFACVPCSCFLWESSGWGSKPSVSMWIQPVSRALDPISHFSGETSDWVLPSGQVRPTVGLRWDNMLFITRRLRFGRKCVWLTSRVSHPWQMKSIQTQIECCESGTRDSKTSLTCVCVRERIDWAHVKWPVGTFFFIYTFFNLVSLITCASVIQTAEHFQIWQEPASWSLFSTHAGSGSVPWRQSSMTVFYWTTKLVFSWMRWIECLKRMRERERGDEKEWIHLILNLWLNKFFFFLETE